MGCYTVKHKLSRRKAGYCRYGLMVILQDNPLSEHIKRWIMVYLNIIVFLSPVSCTCIRLRAIIRSSGPCNVRVHKIGLRVNLSTTPQHNVDRVPSRCMTCLTPNLETYDSIALCDNSSSVRFTSVVRILVPNITNESFSFGIPALKILPS